MKKLLVKSFCLAGIIFISSCNTGETKTETDSKEVAKEQNEQKFDDHPMEDDTKFAVATADGGMMEVQMAQLALTNATSPEVKKHAQMMIDDHSKVNEELKALAASKNISLPATLSEDKQKKYKEFTEKKGADFDKAYTDFMVEDHKEDIDAFKKQAEKGNDSTLKAWAAGKIPTLEQHLKMWETAKEVVKKSK